MAGDEAGAVSSAENASAADAWYLNYDEDRDRFTRFSLL